jgi:hypothetical protein
MTEAYCMTAHCCHSFVPVFLTCYVEIRLNKSKFVLSEITLNFPAPRIWRSCVTPELYGISRTLIVHVCCRRCGVLPSPAAVRTHLHPPRDEAFELAPSWLELRCTSHPRKRISCEGLDSNQLRGCCRSVQTYSEQLCGSQLAGADCRCSVHH